MIELWRVKHLLTGRHYVHMKNGVDDIIRRVRFTHTGRPYAVYFGSHLIWLDTTETGGWVVTPLTDFYAKHEG